MKSTLESWFSGILTSSEIVSADRYSLFVGVSEKTVCVDFIGNSDLPGSFCQNPVLRGSSLSGIYIRNRCLCVDDAVREFIGVLRFFGLVFPQGFFYTLAAYLLWIMVVEQADGKEKIRLWMMIFFMVLGIISGDIHKSKFFSADLPTVLERHI